MVRLKKEIVTGHVRDSVLDAWGILNHSTGGGGGGYEGGLGTPSSWSYGFRPHTTYLASLASLLCFAGAVCLHFVVCVYIAV
jgi:hypothetical protein